MIDSSASPASVELVSARIEEKRLFEARFLFKKFSSTIDSPVRQQIQRRLDKKIELARQHFAQARQLEEQQQYEEAEKGYGRVLDVAVDFPAIEQALQRVAVARKLGPLQPPVSPASEEQVSLPGVPADTPVEDVRCAPTFSLRWKLLLFSLVVAVSTSILFIAWDIFHQQGTSFRPVAKAHLETTSQNTDQPAHTSVVLSAIPEVSSEKAAQKDNSEEIILPRAIAPPIVKNISLPGKETVAISNKIHPDKDSTDLRTDGAGNENTPGETTGSEKLDDHEGVGVIRVVISGREPRYTRADPSIATVVDVRNSEVGKVLEKKKTGKAILRDDKHLSPEIEQGIYTVQSGDSLGKIAQKVYGSSRKWQQLYDLNRDSLSSPAALRIGQKLRTVRKIDEKIDPDPVGE